MQFSEAWLRSLVNPALNTQQLGHLLTMAGLEVEALAPAAAPFDQVVVAEILSAEKHPDADRLQVCRVAVGEAEPLTIVCGAPNARAGLKTACARVGAVLPGDFRIKEAKVRGVASFGMLCSAKELGMPAGGPDGILELAADAPVGASLRDCLALDDTLITLKLTPNRGDCQSLTGLAREVAALTGAPMLAVDCEAVSPTHAETHPVEILEASACPRYCGRVIRGVRVDAVTPDWMRRRLERCGLNVIHPVVDVTNYVLLELGQPMHAFDLERLSGPVRARMSQPGESLALLNGQNAEIQPGTLLIADDNGPLALAGTMGGQGSAVSGHTTSLFLEAAHFTPEALAGRARAHGLATDSSHRFERGVDPELPLRAMERATRLILDLCGGEAGPVVAHGPGVSPRPAFTFRPDRARKLLGFALEDARMLDILRGLGIHTEARDEAYLASAPSYRFDLNREVDLIEEIARVHGYDAIPAMPLLGPHALMPAPENRRAILELKQCLAARGFQEIVTYSFISETLDAQFRHEGEPMPLLNPIAAPMSQMRGSLLSGLVQTLRHNLNHGQERLKLFEIGRVFISADQQPRRLGMLMHGAALDEQWGSATRAADFYDLKAELEALFHPRVARLIVDTHPALHPGQCARAEVDGQPAGWIGALHPVLAQSHGLTRSTILLEVDLDAVLARDMPRYARLAAQPAVRRDLAVVVDENASAGAMLESVRTANPPLVVGFELFDVYRGTGVEQGKKSLAFKVLVQHTEKTLTDSEIQKVVEDILKILQTNHSATLRA